MAWPMKPYNLKCPECCWSITVAPTSDVIMPWELPKLCPKCNSKSIVRTQASAIEAAMAQFKRRLGIQG
jgi:Zn finger protein HypA/HybF involved in hydrogenase expression